MSVMNKQINEVEIIERLKSEGLQTRGVPVTFDAKSKTVRAVFASENPVDEYDWQRGEVLPTVLLASGFEYPEKVPMLDSHERGSVAKVLGSGRDMVIEGENLMGRLYFGRSAAAIEAAQMVEDGHITDVSVAYKSIESVIVERGSQWKDEKGRSFNGPMKVSTKTSVREISLVPIGADAMAKIRSAETPKQDIRDIEIEKLRNENSELKQKLDSAFATIKMISIN